MRKNHGFTSKFGGILFILLAHQPPFPVDIYTFSKRCKTPPLPSSSSSPPYTLHDGKEKGGKSFLSSPWKGQRRREPCSRRGPNVAPPRSLGSARGRESFAWGRGETGFYETTTGRERRPRSLYMERKGRKGHLSAREGRERVRRLLRRGDK